MFLNGYLSIQQLLKKDPDQSEVRNALRIDSPEDNPEVLDIEEPRLSFGVSVEDHTSRIKEQVRLYREMLNNHEIEDAVTEIVNESVILNDDTPVSVDLDNVELSENVKNKIIEEFDHILNILDFKRDGDDYFKRWYVDGRLYVQKIIDQTNIKMGIQDAKILSPTNLVKIREKESGRVFYLYKPEDRSSMAEKHKDGLKIPEEHITFIPSGLLDSEGTKYISYLSRASKPLNQLKMLEDATIIYRITRAPERRAFYVDVGKMPKTKAEAYIRSLMTKFKNRVVYDSSTGKLKQQKDVMTMTEDFWLPTSSDGKGTKIETLQGGQQLGEITDVEYFKKKLLKSLKVPYSRFDNDTSASMVFGNMNGEISREEMRFAKFINRLRDKFALLFYDLLKTQLLLKKIITPADWPKIRNDIVFRWTKDQYYEQIAKQESLSAKLDLLGEIKEYVGKNGYFSKEYVYREILNMTKEEEDDMKKKQQEEDAAGEYGSEEDNDF